MRSIVGRRVRRLAAIAVVLFSVAGGIAYATVPDSNNVFNACMLNNGGFVRLIDTSLPSSSFMSHCMRWETAISWNQHGANTGVTGARGPKGDTGAQGAKGDTGTTGPPGPAGISGYEIVTANPDAAAGKALGDPMSAVLTCPTGKKVLSGGEGGDWGLGVSAAAPSSDGTAWTVTGVVQEDSFTGLSVWAICATA